MSPGGRGATDERPADESDPAALVDQAMTAYVGGDAGHAVRLLHRAYFDYEGRSSGADADDALHVACTLALVFATTGQLGLFNGWLARAQRLLTERQSEGVLGEQSLGRGYVAVLELHQAVIGSGDPGALASLASEVFDAGRRHHVADLLTLGLTAQGRYAIVVGDVGRGLTLLDEAMASILAGETSPVVTGLAWCAAIEGCQEIGAIDRLCEWTAALETWCEERPNVASFTGECALHTGQVSTLHGAWSEAAAEFAAARDRFDLRHEPWSAGRAECERGDLLRLQGRDAEAEAAYHAAAERGCDPQPGLALLWLARGQHGPAIAAIQRCLTETALPVQRIGLLPAALDALLAVGRDDDAEALLDEFDELAALTGLAPAAAAAAHAHARVELTHRDARGALPYARKAAQSWGNVGCPFEAARSRVALARALAELGDVESCRRELLVARSVFADLGAVPSESLVDRLLADLEGGQSLGRGVAATERPNGLTAREVEVLRLVASGRSNRQIAAALTLSDKTVARHVSNIFVKLEVQSRTEAAAFAYEHGLA